MASETITVYIDRDQLTAQKSNGYSLFLAKMVNKQFTVIWQSRGAFPTVNNPAVYEPMNIFNVAVPSYQVNYTTDSITSGSVTFTATGIAQPINVGQTTVLDKFGLFGAPSNSGTPGEVTITNQLPGNPHDILLDDQGKPIFVNIQSGMDLGTATLTPIDTYQLWFDNLQDTGTIIAHNVSTSALVVFDGGTDNKVISFNKAGVWQEGPLAQPLDLGAGLDAAQVGDPVTIAVIAAFTFTLTAAAATYLASKLIDKFPNNIRPKKITVSGDRNSVEVDFYDQQNRQILAAFGPDKFGEVVNQALLAAKADDPTDLGKESWTIKAPSVSVSY